MLKSRYSKIFALARSESSAQVMRSMGVVPIRGDLDPTGAGDAFAISSLVARSAGQSPTAAARRASSVVAGILAGRARQG